MKITSRAILVALVLVLSVHALFASGQVGVYAIISRVVLEPNESNPERIQLWGAFTFVESSTSTTLKPQRGTCTFDSPSRKTPF